MTEFQDIKQKSQKKMEYVCEECKKKDESVWKWKKGLTLIKIIFTLLQIVLRTLMR